jgi:deoxyribodipyrimidine photolyase
MKNTEGPRFPRSNKIQKQLRELQNSYAEKAVKLVFKEFDPNKETERYTAFYLLNSVDLAVAFAFVGEEQRRLKRAASFWRQISETRRAAESLRSSIKRGKNQRGKDAKKI